MTLNAGTTNYLDYLGTVLASSGTGAAVFSSPVVLQANTTITTTNANITFLSTVDAAVANTQTLSLTAGTGAVAFQGTVGTTALGGLTVTSAGSVSATTTVTVNGAGNGISLSADGQVSLGGTVANTNGAGNILIKPVTETVAINLSNGAAGMYLSAASLANLAPTGGTVTVGSVAAGYSGAIGIGSSGSIGALNYNLTIDSNSGSVSFVHSAAGNTLSLASGYNLTLALGHRHGHVERDREQRHNTAGRGNSEYYERIDGMAGRRTYGLESIDT